MPQARSVLARVPAGVRVLGCVLLLAGGCAPPPAATPIITAAPPPTAPKGTLIVAGPDAAKKAQEALILAKSGEVVEFAEGTFDFKSTLSLDVSGVTIRGAGPGKTILSFRDQAQGTGGEGLLVTAKRDFTLEHLSVVDAKGDAVKVNGTSGVVLRDVAVSWSGGPKETNGGYGLYPVLCTDVLIEDCRVSDASDAGIYVGQSRNIIVRRNTAEGNVAGIELENSVDADVYENTATGNTGGILVFTLPDLPKKEGRNCRVFRNKISANNHANFAPKGNIVATVPPGTGLMVMACDNVEVYANDIEQNDSTGVTVVSYLLTMKPIADKGYNPYCEGIFLHDNRFAENGRKPGGTLPTLLSKFLGTPLPDILYDGMVDPKASASSPKPLCLADNGEAKFARFDVSALTLAAAVSGKSPGFVRDPKEFTGTLPRLPGVTLGAAK